MRFARRTDNNQKTIVEALRAAGAKVKVIHQPFDLQVWADNGKTMYIEVKNPMTPYGKRGANAKQAEESQGLPYATVYTVEAAIRAYEVLQS